ncbi:hypothetical protein HQ447_12280 [bacterium]|nr:hypothetical protein [bacterium]
MNLPPIIPDWKWGTAEGSQELDRLLDRRLTFREKIEWLEEAENLTLAMAASREKLRLANTTAPSLVPPA